MDLKKILERKELEARDSNNSRLENYAKEHPSSERLVEFKGCTIPYSEAEALEEIIQKYKLDVDDSVRFNNGHVTYLSLYSEGIKSIGEIPGLENLTNLRKLYLTWNKIKEIKGLETLTNLQELSLWKNKIKEIKGLENLTNLRGLDLGNNKLNRKSKKIANSLRERGVSVWT